MTIIYIRYIVTLFNNHNSIIVIPVHKPFPGKHLTCILPICSDNVIPSDYSYGNNNAAKLVIQIRSNNKASHFQLWLLLMMQLIIIKEKKITKRDSKKVLVGLQTQAQHWYPPHFFYSIHLSPPNPGASLQSLSFTFPHAALININWTSLALTIHQGDSDVLMSVLCSFSKLKKIEMRVDCLSKMWAAWTLQIMKNCSSLTELK